MKSSTLDAIQAMRESDATARAENMAEYRRLISTDQLSEAQQGRLRAVMSDLGFDPSHLERDRTAIEQASALDPQAAALDSAKQAYDDSNQVAWQFTQEMNAKTEEMRIELSRLRGLVHSAKYRMGLADEARQRLAAIRTANPRLFGVVVAEPAPLVSSPSDAPGRGIGPRRVDGSDEPGTIRRGRGCGLSPVS